MDKLLTPAHVAEMLAISRRKAYALKHEIGYIAVGGNVRFEQSAVEAYIEKCRRLPVQPSRKQWESRSGTIPPGVTAAPQPRITAADIKERLEQKRRQKK